MVKKKDMDIFGEEADLLNSYDARQIIVESFLQSLPR
jgi:hypothetical protein